MDAIYGVDFGGTNLRIAEVNPITGALIKSVFSVPVTSVKTNDELTHLVLSQLKGAKHIGISASGNIDEKNLIIRNSPNSHIKGNITFGKTLRQKGFDVVMCNDIKAAVQGVARFGEGKNYNNVLVATYSSGYNCAVCRDKKNTTTAEFGHTIYKPNSDLFCGCGGIGHLEIFVSGNGAASMAKQYFLITKQRNHSMIKFSLRDYNEKNSTKYTQDALKNPDLFAVVVSNITSRHVYGAYASDPKQEPQRNIREVQVRAIADSFGKMNSAFNPLDIMVLMGGQTKDKKILFDPAIRLYNDSVGAYQLHTLNKPKIVITKLEEVSLVGAVGYFLNQREA
ncbi:MAG: ROK family protein [Candidatus Aenigmarchaeota archaeon]|nr:ROK family protein [Candidatus Aenigmarchaeota archaeon]